MQDFNDILNGVTDGTKNLNISALTMAGTLTANGNVALGASSSNTLAFNAALNSSVPVNTNNSFDIGSSTKGLAGIYLGNAGVGVTARVISASHATARTYTVPDCGAAASFVMTQGAQTVAGVTTFSGGIILASDTLSAYTAPVTFTPSESVSGGGSLSGGSYTTAQYAIVGKMMTVWISNSGYTISGTVNAFLITIPASKTAAVQAGTICRMTQGGTNGSAHVAVGSGGTSITVENITGTNFTTGSFGSQYTLTFPIS